MNPYAWKCQTGSWKAPWSIHLESAGVGHRTPVLVNLARGAVMNLLDKMAWNAFGSISLTGLIRIRRYIGQTCNAKDGLVKVLLDVCERALFNSLGERGLTDEEALPILRHRVTMDDSEIFEFLHSEEAQDLLDKRDKDGLDKHQEFVVGAEAN